MFSGFASQATPTTQSSSSSASQFTSWMSPQNPNQTQPQQSAFTFQQPQNSAQQLQSSVQQSGQIPSQITLLLKNSNPQAPPMYANGNTKFEDLHPTSQAMLKQIEDHIRKHRKGLSEIGNCPRMVNPHNFNDRTESMTNISQIIAGIKELSSKIEPIISQIDASRASFSDAYGNITVSYYNRILSHHNSPQNNSQPLLPSPMQSSLYSSSPLGAYSQQHLPVPSAMASQGSWFGAQDAQLRGSVNPSPFLILMVQSFTGRLQECELLLSKIESSLHHAEMEWGESRHRASMEEMVQTIKKTLLDFNYLINRGAGEVSVLDDDVQVLKAQYLTMLQRRGDQSNPFTESDSAQSNNSASMSSMTQLSSSYVLPTPPPQQQQQLPLPTLQPNQPAASTSGSSLFSSFLSSPSLTASSSPASQSIFGTPTTTLPSTMQSPSPSMPFSSPPTSTFTLPSSFSSSPSPSSSSLFTNPATSSLFGSAPNSFNAFSSSPASSSFPSSTPFSSPSPSFPVPNLLSTPPTSTFGGASASTSTASRSKSKTGSRRK